MKLHNEKDIKKLMKAIDTCEQAVWLRDPVNNDINLNLKSKLSQYLGIGQLISEAGEFLELYASTKSDEAILLNCLRELDEHRE